MTNLTNRLNQMATDIHARNVKAGWWSDLATGESTLAIRNRAEMLMLVVSENTEADDGFIDNLNDDKLSHLPMFDVELADVAIRLCDMIGAEEALYGDRIEFDFDEAAGDAYYGLHDKSHERQLLEIINCCSKAMEHLRKGRSVEHRTQLAWALATTFAVADIRKVDLFDVIQQKLDFNANRADHKIENRLKDDGKKF